MSVLASEFDHRALASELWETNKKLVDALVRLELAATRDEQLLAEGSNQDPEQ